MPDLADSPAFILPGVFLSGPLLGLIIGLTVGVSAALGFRSGQVILWAGIGAIIGGTIAS